MSNAPTINAEPSLQQGIPQGKTLFEQFLATLKDDRLRDLITRLKCLENQDRIIGGKTYATDVPGSISESEIGKLLGAKATEPMEAFEEALNGKMSELNALAEKYPSNQELKNWMCAIDGFIAILARLGLFKITNGHDLSSFVAAKNESQSGGMATENDIGVLTSVVRTKDGNVMRIEDQDAVDILNALKLFIESNPGTKVHNEIQKRREELKATLKSLSMQDIPNFYGN